MKNGFYNFFICCPVLELVLLCNLSYNVTCDNGVVTKLKIIHTCILGLIWSNWLKLCSLVQSTKLNVTRFGQCCYGNRLVSRSFSSFKINLRFQPYLKQLLALNMQVDITSYIRCNGIAKFETKINLPAMVVVEITTLSGD